MASGWIRVAAGLQKVAQAAAAQTAETVTYTAARAAQHGVEVAASARTAAESAARTIHHTSPTPSTTSSSISRHAVQSQQQQQPNTLNAFFNDEAAARTTAASRQSDPNATRIRDSEPSASPVEHVIIHRDTVEQANNGHEDSISGRMPAATEKAREAANDDNSGAVASENRIRTPPQDVQKIKEGKAVPATRVGRALGFANLGLGLAVGTVAEGAARLFGRSDGSSSSSVVMNDRNSDRLAASLCRMRGAALKMGQMLSIQDESLLPPALSRALQQVRQGAEAMPKYQLIQQLESQLGEDWRDKFLRFDMLPFAAASIGQVHRASVQEQDDDGRIKQVVVKVQYPGVARSIESDLRNLSTIVTWSGLAPKGLFIENVIRVGQEELKVECDYVREKQNQKRIKQLVESDAVLRDNNFVVPDVIDELTTDQIITSEFIPGGTIDQAAHSVDQEEKNRIGRTVLYLTMKELFDWRFMQTDPNWGNFLYDVGSRTTGLIDFGATREYSKEFVDGYLRIVWASANRDEETLMEQSHKMGFLTGQENAQMLRAHKLSGFTVGEPFWNDEPFDFRGSSISERMGEHTSVFLKHRLTPPPEELYTLHRKLAGAYMLCIKLGAVVRSRDLLEAIVANHDFQDGMENPVSRKGTS